MSYTRKGDGTCCMGSAARGVCTCPRRTRKPTSAMTLEGAAGARGIALVGGASRPAKTATLLDAANAEIARLTRDLAASRERVGQLEEMVRAKIDLVRFYGRHADDCDVSRVAVVTRFLAGPACTCGYSDACRPLVRALTEATPPATKETP